MTAAPEGKSTCRGSWWGLAVGLSQATVKAERPSGCPAHPQLMPLSLPSATCGPLVSRIVLATVLLLTLVAGAVRVPALFGPDGRLTKDEARLTLAAKGVLANGWPRLPSGRFYSRGLVNAYVMAPSLAWLGPHDSAARLPSALAGALLVPAIFLLGRVLGGTPVGLAAAAFVAVADPLVDWSKVAWPPSLFLLLFTLTVFCWYRGFVEQRGGWQVAGALCYVLAQLTYEFALLLPSWLAVFLALSVARGRRDWYRGRPTLFALCLIGIGLVLFGILGIALRVGTLAGPLGEPTHYFSPRPQLDGARFYFRSLLSDYLVLILAAVLGVPTLIRARPRGAAYLLGLLTLAFLAPAFFVQIKFKEHYGLPILPLLAVLAAAGAASLVHAAARFVRGGRFRQVLSCLGLLAVFGLALRGDLTALSSRLKPPGDTWLQVLEQQGVRPADLLVAEGPEILLHYLGRVDFYFAPTDYERYVYRAPGTLRSIYTDAVLLHAPGDFERLVLHPNPGRTAWVIGYRAELYRRISDTDPRLLSWLVRTAERVIDMPDGWVLLKLTLPYQTSLNDADSGTAVGKR
jgi:Dolichyl-phosphate-mannose-protein mannosyltransferase